MASRLDQALDEVIRDRRSERSSHSKRNSNNDRFIRRQTDNGGGIRKRLGNNNTQTIRSFVRTVNVPSSDRVSESIYNLLSIFANHLTIAC
jgi:hypothetical protein